MAAAYSRCAARSRSGAPLRCPSFALFFPFIHAAARSCRVSIIHRAAPTAAFRSLHAAIAGAAATSRGLPLGSSTTCSHLPAVRDTAMH